MKYCRPWLPVCIVCLILVGGIAFLPSPFAAGDTSILHDDFDGTYRWGTNSGAKFASGYSDGELFVRIEDYGHEVTKLPPHDYELPSRFVVETEARKLPGANDVVYGIALLLEDGEVMCLSVTTTGAFSTTAEPRAADWESSLAIRTGTESNRIQVFVIGREATLVVNGISLATLDLGSERPSRVGLLTRGYRGIPVEVRFDFVAVREAARAEVAAPTEGDAASPLETPPAAEACSFRDDFNDLASGWSSWSSHEAGFDYEDGDYRLWGHRSDGWLLSWAPLPSRCEDAFIIEASASIRSGDPEVAHGIFFGVDDFNYYMFMVVDGMYVVWHSVDGASADPPVPFSYSSAVALGGEINKLKVAVMEGRASIHVNGVRLATFEITSTAPYHVALATGAGDAADVRFSDFSVRSPTEDEILAMSDPAIMTDFSLPFSDQFADTGSRWTTDEFGNGGRDYRDGEFAFWLTEPFSWQYAWAPFDCWAPMGGECRLDSFQADATAYKHSGQDDAMYAIIWGPDDVSNYSFLVSADGWYKVDLLLNSEWQQSPIDWTQSPHIRQGGEPNTLTVAYRDSYVALESGVPELHEGEVIVGINGVRLASFKPTLDGPHLVGMRGDSFETAPVEVRFTGFEIRELEEGNPVTLLEAEAPGCSLPFLDDYSDAAGWETGTGTTGGRAYRDGEFAIWCAEPFQYYYSWAPLASACSAGFQAEATAYKHSGENDAMYAIIWGPSNTNHYSFILSADGWYKVDLLMNGEWQPSPIDWAQNSRIRQGGEPNTLNVVVRDGRATLEVNGVRLGSFPLILEGPYLIGVRGDSGETAPIEVRFTEFSVKALE